jgi:hypothetical protein
MSLIHMDDFNGYGRCPFDTNGADLMLAGIYAGFTAPNQISATVSPGLVADPDGVSTPCVLQCGPAGQNQDLAVRYVFPSGVAETVGVACRVWYEQLPANGNNGIAILSDTSGYSLMLCVTSTGRLQIRTGFYGTIVATSNLPAITAQGWWHIEFKLFNDDTVGTIEVRVEGVPVPGLVLTGIDTAQYGAYAQVAFMQSGAGGGASHTYYVKDFATWNGNGTNVNDFVGTCIINAHEILSDFQLGWDLFGGTSGFEILSNDPPISNEYIFAEQDPFPDPYQGVLSPMPPDVVTVKACLVRAMSGKNDGGDGYLQAGMVADANGAPATALGADRPISIAQTFRQDIFPLNPKTATAWLPSNFDDGNVLVQLDRTV